MDWVVIHAFVISFWACIFWGTIRIADKHNATNTFGKAVGLAMLADFAHFGGIPSMVYLGAWLLLLMRLTMHYYNLNLLGAIVVTASTVLSPYFIGPELVKFVGDSELRAYLVLYGLPLVAFGIWIGLWIRGMGRSPAGDVGDGVLPRARLQRWIRRKRVAKPVEVAPIVAPSPIVAPKLADPPRADGQPTFLS